MRSYSILIWLTSSILFYTLHLTSKPSILNQHPVQIPALLLMYDCDAVFAQVMIDYLEKTTNINFENSTIAWIRGSSRAAIFTALEEAQKKSLALKNFESSPKLFEKNNPVLYASFTAMKKKGTLKYSISLETTNLPVLQKAAHHAQQAINAALAEFEGPDDPILTRNNTCTLPYSFALERVMRLRYLANRLDKLRPIDNDLEFQGLYPALFAKLNKQTDLKDLVEALDDDIQELKNKWKGSKQELEQCMTMQHSFFLNRNTH